MQVKGVSQGFSSLVIDYNASLPLYIQIQNQKSTTPHFLSQTLIHNSCFLSLGMPLALTWRSLALLWWFHHLKILFEISIGSNEREWKKMKFGLCREWFGQEMSEIWQKEVLGMRVLRERMSGFWFLISKSEYIGAGMRCNRLQNLVIDYTLRDLL